MAARVHVVIFKPTSMASRVPGQTLITGGGNSSWPVDQDFHKKETMPPAEGDQGLCAGQINNICSLEEIFQQRKKTSQKNNFKK